MERACRAGEIPMRIFVTSLLLVSLTTLAIPAVPASHVEFITCMAGGGSLATCGPICQLEEGDAKANHIVNCCDYPVDDPAYAALGNSDGVIIIGEEIENCPNSAGPCGSAGSPAVGQIQIKPAPGVGVYIDDRNFVLGNGFWIYVESNGENGLQRGGVHPVLGELDAEICEEGNPDTLIL